MANPVYEAATLAWKPADLRPPWQWAEDHYTVPVSSSPGKWSSEQSPWVRRLMEKYPDNSIRQITVLCSAQSAKTETGLVLLAWTVAEDPSPTMWVTANDEEALKFANERLMPALKLCPPVAKQVPDDRTLTKSTAIQFPTMMLECVGAKSKDALQSRPRRFLFLDEVRNWPKWALPMVLKRSRTWWNSRTIIMTTPDEKNDPVHIQFLAGSQEHYHVPCQHCGVKAPLVWEQLKAEHPVTHKCVPWDEIPGARSDLGKWNVDALSPHLRYVCKSCGHMHADDPVTRFRMTVEGEWVSHNPLAPADHISFTWNAMLPTWVKWKSLVTEYINAIAANEFGDHELLKAFYTESLGLPWDDKIRFAKSDGYLDSRMKDFDPRAPWSAEVRRFMCVDVQGKGGRHFYYTITAFAQGGAHRILSFGKAYSVEELRSIQADWGVASQNVGIDSGNWAAEVYGYIIDSGVLPNGDYAWKAMKGDRAPHYMGANGIRLPFTWSFVDPFLGTAQQNSARPIRQLLFSKSALLDRAEAIMRGVGPVLEIATGSEMIQEFKMQLTAYERMERTATTTGEVKSDWNQKRPDDHWGSCYRMSLVCAYATELMEIRP